MKLTIESTQKSIRDTEIILQKALSALTKQRNERPFDPPLQKPVQETEQMIDKVLENMMTEINQVLRGDD